jgi:hypothetical protein
MRRERLGPIKRHAYAARRRTPTASRERGRGRTNRVAARAAAPGVNQKLQVLRAAWLPFGDRLLRRLLALLGGLVACVQLHRSAWPQVGRALRCALGSGGWDCRAWEAGDGRQRVGKSVGRVAACAGTAGRCRASVRASVQPLTSHLGLNKRLSRLLLRSRRTGRQHLHSRARDAARLTRLRRQWRQKAGAGRGQAEHTGTPHQHAEQQGKVVVQRTLGIIGVWGCGWFFPTIPCHWSLYDQTPSTLVELTQIFDASCQEQQPKRSSHAPCQEHGGWQDRMREPREELRVHLG